MRFTTMNVRNNINLEAQQLAQRFQVETDTEKQEEYTKQINEELTDERIIDAVTRYQARERGQRKYEYDR